MQRDVPAAPRARADAAETEVKFGPASYIGYGVAVLSAVLAALDAIGDSGLSSDGALMAKISAVLVAVISAGRMLQAAFAKIFPPKSDA